ncbi:MAG TPA: substrate-binding domain-containing protein [Bacteroidales bacterium]|nr:substrate-binding domain-containing protein [Bacteroidales bacterium]HSA42142.1 substrate-binding domain-containing protein [Bacteroidales bacterium]
MKMRVHLSGLVIVSVFFITTSCQRSRDNLDETPTRGNIRIAADESFKPLIDTQVQTFMSLYAYAVITPRYLPEADVIADLLNDSVRAIVVTRDLTQEERDRLLAGQVVARTTKIAYDAVALILHQDNPDDQIRYDQVAGIMDGSIRNWNQLNPKSSLGDIVVVFDNRKSGNFRLLQERFLKDKPLPSSLYAVNSNPEVLEYVRNNRNAIGVIGVNWISDRDDTTSNNFLKDIRIAAIGREGDTEGEGDFIRPYQWYIAESSYPFKREVYAICRESFTGLGTGFVQFVAGDVGQRMVLKSGLVPATMPVRLVQFKQ